MPKAPKSPRLHSGAQPSRGSGPRRSSPKARTTPPGACLGGLADLELDAKPEPAAAVPAWLRTDWSETSFEIPNFAGDYCPGPQFEWAAKNATVAIHDAFAAGSWEGITDRRKAIDYAICDVVLQR